MKVEIWSDVVCPFCYLGKRKFEKALEQFGHKDEVEVEWHSFQLDPHIQNTPGMSIHEYLAGRKAVTVEEAMKMHSKMNERVKDSGLHYDYDAMIPANTFNAHRLIQFAKSRGLQEQAEERLFHAYFSEGKDIANINTLTNLGNEIGLDRAETEAVLGSERFTDEVKHDLYHAHSIGVQGVPFFVFNDKYAISGAQASEMFLSALTRTWNEMHNPAYLESGKA